MLVEKALNQALIDYTKGKKVYIVQEYDDKSMDISDLADFLEDKSVRMLVDVPAVDNPEFKEAVCEMTDGSSSQTEEPKEAPQKESQERSAEPKDCGGGNTEPPQRAKKEIVEELVLQGLSNSEIVEKTGIKYQTVYLYAKQVRDNQPKKPKEQQVLEDNSDRHLCKICAYRGSVFQGKSANSSSATGCEYAIIKGHPRGCSADNCNVFEKGNPKKPKKPLVLA